MKFIYFKKAQFTSKYIQRATLLATLSQDETVSNKKESLGNSITWILLIGAIGFEPTT